VRRFGRNERTRGLSVNRMGLFWQQRWRDLTKGEPGRRFEDRYEAARAARPRAAWRRQLLRLLLIMVALGSILVGVVLAFIPGPAVLFFLLAGTLLAAESRGLARLMDWGEVKLRIGWNWARSGWGRLPGWGRGMLLIAGAGLGAAGTYLSYRLMAR
jgi:hypothetical protein